MKYKNLVIEAAVYSFGSYFVLPLMLVSNLIVRQNLGPYLTGVIATLTVIGSYVALSHLGVLFAAERELPYCTGSGDRSRFERIRYDAFILVMTPAVVASVGLVAWSLWYRSTLDKPLFVGLLIYSVFLVGQQWSSYYTILLRTSKEFVFLGKAQILFGILITLGNVISVILFGFTGFLWATAIIACLNAWFLTRRAGFLPPLRLRLYWLDAQHLLMIGAPLLIEQFVVNVLRTVDNILVLHLLGTEQLGYYSIALMANAVIFMTTATLSAILFPRMQEAYGLHKTVESLSTYVVRPTIVMGLLLPIMISVLYFVIPVTVYWFLPRFAPGLLAFKIIIVGTYFISLFNMASAFLIALNKQLMLSVLLAGAIVVSVGFALVFFQMGWGLVGIALATVLGYLVSFVITNVYALRHWAQGRQIVAFLWDVTLPILYGGVLLVLLDQYQVAATATGFFSFLVAITKILIFLLAYCPLIMIMERKTRLISEFVRPMVSRVMPRISMF